MSVNDEAPAVDAEASDAAKRLSDDVSLTFSPGQALSSVPSGQLAPEKESRRAVMMEAARSYARRGWRVIPVWWITDEGSCACQRGELCPNPGKHPIHTDWPGHSTDDDGSVTYWWRPDAEMPARDWYPEANIGIVTGAGSGIFALDVDEYNGGALTLGGYERRHGELPVTRVHETGSGGTHYLWAHPGFDIRNSAGKRLGKGLDVRGENGFVVAPPSVSSKGAYLVAPVHDIVPAPAPDWLLGLLHNEERAQRGQIVAGREPSAGTGYARRYAERALSSESERMRDAESGTRNDTLNEVAFSLGTLGGAGLLTEDAAWKSVHEAALSTGLGEDEIRRTFFNGWRAGLAEPRQVQWQLLGGDWPMRARSEFGNGDRMADHFADQLRWCPERKAWFIFMGGCWLPDTSETGEWYAQAMFRRLPDTEGMMYDAEPGESTDGTPEPSPAEEFLGWALKQHTVKACSAAARIARGLPLMRISQRDFDPDGLLLNCLNGVADLQSGQRMEHDPELRMTLQCQTSYHPGATAPGWNRFLETVQPDPEVRDYLQRVIGYSATANTDEQVMFLHHGSGANGKSVFQRIINHILGGYAQVVPVETLLATNVEGRVPNDVARMDGRRLLAAAETRMGKFLDEAKMKMLTGGEIVTARYMRGEFFEFRPVGKIHLTTNHLPRLSDDPATWRRIKLITWPVIIPEGERDPDLADRLIRDEAEGVLDWIIQGAVAWRQRGLDTPESLQIAAEDYREEEDSLVQFISECVISGLPEDKNRIGNKCKDFWAHHNMWAQENGLPEMSQHALTARLKKKFKYSRSNGWSGYLDAQIKTNAQ